MFVKSEVALSEVLVGVEKEAVWKIAIGKTTPLFRAPIECEPAATLVQQQSPGCSNKMTA